MTQGIITAAGLSFVVAILSIAALMAWVQRASFTPFVIYRVVLGAVLLAFAYGWL
jgi:undecaprenyl-diphosphatase